MLNILICLDNLDPHVRSQLSEKSKTLMVFFSQIELLVWVLCTIFKGDNSADMIL